MRVGTNTALREVDRDGNDNIWTLLQTLISHYSPFLEAACSRNFKEGIEKQIELPDDDATVFALFVEWMYYGDYAIPSLSSPLRESVGDSNIDAKCWVLGDKLLCTDFKNHAMSRLYARYTDTAFNRAVTTGDVQYACGNSALKSKMREFYFDLVATQFSDLNRVDGAVEEWDSIVSEYKDMRLCLLQTWRKGGGVIKNVEHYLDLDVEIDKLCV